MAGQMRRGLGLKGAARVARGSCVSKRRQSALVFLALCQAYELRKAHMFGHLGIFFMGSEADSGCRSAIYGL